ncbi:tectonin domain-containing protein, partial [Streptomyces sp. NPDC018584]|uniref:tectonin domain-containing protein n=1 Tax=unclassified Streptomyces TaxID=2593676 RepID=UPI00379EDB5F
MYATSESFRQESMRMQHSRADGAGDMADWKQISGGLTRIAAGSRTNVWGVNSAGNIYRYTNNDAAPW